MFNFKLFNNRKKEEGGRNKKVLDERERRLEYKNGMDYAFDYYKYFTPELTKWIAEETDPILLASAYCAINSWGWLKCMPKAADGFDYRGHGWGSKDYNMIKFTETIMKMLESKAEALSPGIKQIVWMTQSFKDLMESPNIFDEIEQTNKS